MKKVIASVGLVAMGAAALQAADSMTSVTAPEATKPYTLGMVGRGFFDDNIATRSSDQRKSSYGFEVSPSAALRLNSEVTQLRAEYIYSMRYFFDRSPHRADHMHQLDASLHHAFSERCRVKLEDSFAIAQEPTILGGGVFVNAPIRANGNNMRNVLNANVDGDLTEKIGLGLGYQNTWYDYQNHGQDSSYSALLDRFEHLFSVNLKYKVAEPTIALVGYQFGAVHYTAKDRLQSLPVVIMPNARDNYSHYYFLGVDHQFNPQLMGSARAGAQTIDYHKLAGSKLRTSPYFDVALTYKYMEGCAAQLGYKYSRMQTDVYTYTAGGNFPYTLDAQSSALYGSVEHSFIPEKFIGKLTGTYQNSNMRGGPADGKKEDFVVLGADLTYNFTKFLAGQAGYNLDLLKSDLDMVTGYRSYHRNRVYLGVKATF